MTLIIRIHYNFTLSNMNGLVFILLFVCFPAISLAGWTKISVLHPTQFSVGMEEVRDKQDGLAGMKNSKRREYLKKHPVPVIKGPNGEKYIVDHHHLTRAAWQAGEDEVYTEVVQDWSNLGRKDFWRKMIETEMVYLYDADGKGPQDPKILPENVYDMTDDPYRSLAWKVKVRGAIDKVKIPFFEFRWAQFFRALISSWSTPEEWNEAVEQGIRLAKTHPDAALLPGYIAEKPKKRCRVSFTVIAGED